MADGKITIDTSLNNKGFTKGLKNMEGQTNGLTAAVKKLGAVMASVFAVRAIVNFGKECVELGSNISEVQNVVDVAFGDMAYKIEVFSNSAIENFGMSRLAAKKTASTYMAMAKGMGIADESASDMAISLTGLSADVASFFNISQELADIKLKSVFTGETETLKDLGVVMTQDNLKAYALTQGITKNYDAMTQAEKVALRYNFVLDSFALANGDFARTSDSWANQTRMLSMQWQEFMSIIGQALITVLTPLVEMLNTIVSALINVANTVNSIMSSLFGGANTQIQQTETSAADIGNAIEGSAESQADLTDETKETAKAQKKLLAGFDEIQKISGDTAGGSADSSGGALDLIGGSTTLAAETIKVEEPTKAIRFFEELQKAMQPTVDALGRLWGVLQNVGSFAGDALVDFYNSFLKPVGEWVMGEGLPRFIDAVSNGLAAVDWQRINDALHNVWEALAPFAKNVGEGLLWFWENVLVPWGTWHMNEVLPRFLDLVALAIEGLNAIIEIAKPVLLWLWGNFLQPVGKWAGEIFIAALDVIIGLFEVIVGILTGDFDRALEGANTAVNGLKRTFDLLGQGAQVVWDAIKLAWGVFSDWFHENVISPIKATLDKVGVWVDTHVIAPVTKGFTSFINGLISMVESFVNFFIRGINKVVDALNNLSFTVPDWVPGIGGETWGFDISKVAELKLPRLATGAVIPPNREFMAVLGDQKRGTNIEAPLETMVQAFKQAAREIVGAGNGNTTIIMELDGQQFGKVVYKANKAESRRVGVSLSGV